MNAGMPSALSCSCHDAATAGCAQEAGAGHDVILNLELCIMLRVTQVSSPAFIFLSHTKATHVRGRQFFIDILLKCHSGFFFLIVHIIQNVFFLSKKVLYVFRESH